MLVRPEHEAVDSERPPTLGRRANGFSTEAVGANLGYPATGRADDGQCPAGDRRRDNQRAGVNPHQTREMHSAAAVAANDRPVEGMNGHDACHGGQVKRGQLSSS